jgi:hypothetical protein
MLFHSDQSIKLFWRKVVEYRERSERLVRKKINPPDPETAPADLAVKFDLSCCTVSLRGSARPNLPKG